MNADDLGPVPVVALPPEPCPLCRDVGWILEDPTGHEPLALELLPCLLPDCARSGIPIEVLSTHGRFARAVLHPTTRQVMSVAGARAPHDPSIAVASRPVTQAPARGAAVKHGALPPGASPAGPTPS